MTEAAGREQLLQARLGHTEAQQQLLQAQMKEAAKQQEQLLEQVTYWQQVTVRGEE